MKSDQTRHCKACGKEKKITDFTVTNTNHLTGRRYYAWTCKKCRAKQVRQKSNRSLPEAALKERKRNREFNVIARWPAPEFCRGN